MLIHYMTLHKIIVFFTLFPSVSASTFQLGLVGSKLPSVWSYLLLMKPENVREKNIEVLHVKIVKICECLCKGRGPKKSGNLWSFTIPGEGGHQG